ncbi:MAG: hypothetical protein J6Z36_00830 [Clostridia bacterium]|nr:hypothetical protein [Clostridia bacterium]
MATNNGGNNGNGQNRRTKESAIKKKNTASASSAAKKAVIAGVAAAASGAAAKKLAKKSPAALILAVLALIIGAVAGFFALNTLTQNDGYAMLGEEDFAVDMGADYVDAGVKAIFLGKDYSDSVTMKYYYRENISYDQVEVSGVDTGIDGFYYVVYQSDAFPFNQVTLIRTVEVVGGDSDGEE